MELKRKQEEEDRKKRDEEEKVIQVRLQKPATSYSPLLISESADVIIKAPLPTVSSTFTFRIKHKPC